ncbi:MAG TPA: transglycosylase SLT domain-containing protein [Acidimicrobiia bacterium]|nr:transglycosylase SLT domain-containing protein [Acidimicrobiia bacterium]
MKVMRFLTLALAAAVAIPVVSTDGLIARAQDVGEAEGDAAEARERAEVASRLVEAAVANRAEIELDLAATIERLNVLADELSALSVGLDRISEQLGFADLELAGIQTDIESRAVDVYMSALSSASMAVVNSRSIEEAMITGKVVEDVISSQHAEIDGLVVKKKDLQQLQADFAAQHEAVAVKQAEFDAEVEHLAALFDQADTEVGEAVRAASTADLEYRAALDDVAEAKAKAAEASRQAENNPVTTTTTPGSTTTTAPPVTTAPGSGEPWIPPPEVEQWRGLVSEHFPSNRVEEALHIMWCESHGDPDAYNPYSGASGLFQFIPSTWASASASAGYSGASAFDAEANTATAAWLAGEYARLGLYYWQPWSCKRVLS